MSSSFGPLPAPPAAQGPIDVVYTWVDDAWPGYADTLSRWARTSHDRNPNRTRDNLALLKYSLRSLERFAPWVRRVHLVTMRPQVPDWLEPSAVSLVHHDALLEARHLPTFSSFAILSALHRVPQVSERFLYLEDDRFFLREVRPTDFERDGQLLLYADAASTPGGAERLSLEDSPWNHALRNANRVLDERYGARLRASIKKAPLFVHRDAFAACTERFATHVERTRASRFRGADGVAFEHLYPWMMWHEGRARLVPQHEAAAAIGYVGLERVAPYNRFALAALSLRRPKLACLNDNYGAAPPQAAVEVARRFLERTFPRPSRFERC